MIVSFTTSSGAVYHLDHDNNHFVQETPILREGNLYNKPVVKIGQRVVIWTDPPASHPQSVGKAIQTGIVTKREVSLA